MMKHSESTNPAQGCILNKSTTIDGFLFCFDFHIYCTLTQPGHDSLSESTPFFFESLLPEIIGDRADLFFLLPLLLFVNVLLG